MIRLFVSLLLWSLRAQLKSSGTLVIENLALRQQLAAYASCQKRVHVQPQPRMFWAELSKVWASWRSALIIVKPATVIAWHRRGFQRYWRWRSRKPGRPRVPGEHIVLIRRISCDHPEWGEDKSARQVLQVCREYVNYYNGARPSQALHAIPESSPELRTPPMATGRVIRELKFQLKIDDMPSGDKAATECLLYAAFFTMAFGRKLLRALQVRQRAKDKPAAAFLSERWTIVMRSVAPQLLELRLGPQRARRTLKSRLWIVLQREAPDPNRSRMLLLERAQCGVLRHDLEAARQITDENAFMQTSACSQLEILSSPGNLERPRLRYGSAS